MFSRFTHGLIWIPTLLLVALGCVPEVASTSGPEHCGEIRGDEVWAPDLNPHVVTCDVLVEGGSLTIAAGTEVRFENDTGILVSTEGGTADLLVEGTEERPVELRSNVGEGAGLYRGLLVGPAAGEVTLRHTTLESAGGFNTIAAIRSDSTDLTLDHVTIRLAAEHGLYLWAGAGLTPESTALVIEQTDGWPVRIDMDRADTLPALDSDYRGNLDDGIFVEGSGTDHATVRGPREWEDLGVPYYLMGDLALEGEATRPAVLTLLEGVELRFDDRAALEMSQSGGASGLLALGSPERPVVLGSLGAEDRGAWPGILAHDDVEDESFALVHTVIEHGGGFNNTACLRMESVSVYVEDLTLRGCGGSGFDLWQESFFQEGSSGLVVTDSDSVGEIWAHLTHTVPTEGLALTGNDVDVLRVGWGDDGLIDREVHWADLGVPYRITRGLRIEGDSTQPGVLDVAPGVRIEVVGRAGAIEVGRTAGALRAIGTPDAPIVFTAADAPDSGAWAGIELFDGTVDSETVLENAVIEWGGGLNSIANLTITDANPTLTDVHIAGSAGWGIYLYGDAAPVMQGVTFEGNAEGDVGSL